MTGGNSGAYYSRREQDELRLAAKAVDPAIAKIHLELAERYAAQAEAGGLTADRHAKSAGG